MPQNTIRDPDSTPTVECDRLAEGKFDKTPIGECEGTPTGECERLASGKADSTATCSTGAQRGFSTDADYTLHERETHCSVLTVELGMKGAEEEQEKTVNEVSVECENAQTLSVQASELKEMEPLNSSAEQVSHCTMYCEYICSWEIFLLLLGWD